MAVDVWQNPNVGRLEVQDGYHRTEAAKRAGLNKIPVNTWVSLMCNKYQAMFIVPADVESVLSEGGWEFHGVGRLDSSIEKFLIVFLGVRFSEEWSGVRRYKRLGLNADFYFDDFGEIEYIYFQVFDDFSFFASKLSGFGGLSKDVVLFIP